MAPSHWALCCLFGRFKINVWASASVTSFGPPLISMTWARGTDQPLLFFFDMESQYAASRSAGPLKKGRGGYRGERSCYAPGVPMPPGRGSSALGKFPSRLRIYLPALFVQAAWVVLVRVGPKHWERYGLKSWIEAAKKRLHHNVLATCLGGGAGLALRHACASASSVDVKRPCGTLHNFPGDHHLLDAFEAR
jgi:hypothetical protein